MRVFTGSEVKLRKAGGGIVMDCAGETFAGVSFRRMFPLTAPEEMIEVLSADGESLGFIDDAALLDGASRGLLDAASPPARKAELVDLEEARDGRLHLTLRSGGKEEHLEVASLHVAVLPRRGEIAVAAEGVVWLLSLDEADAACRRLLVGVAGEEEVR